MKLKKYKSVVVNCKSNIKDELRDIESILLDSYEDAEELGKLGLKFYKGDFYEVIEVIVEISDKDKSVGKNKKD